MAVIDRWTDKTVERACRLLMVGESIVKWLRSPQSGQGIRPLTIERWLADVEEFNASQWEEAEHEEAEAE